MSLVRKSEIYLRARRARRARQLQESGKRKCGVNKKTGKPYAMKKSGKRVEVEWPWSLRHKRTGTYRCRITKGGKHIRVIRFAE